MNVRFMHDSYTTIDPDAHWIRRFHESQIWSGPYEEEKNLCPAGNRTLIPRSSGL